jgi:hypothetical protein
LSFIPALTHASATRDPWHRPKRHPWLDPTKIPVDEIVDEWRAQSSKGRYESAMWRAAGLEEPGGERKAKGGLGQSSGELEGGEEVDNLGAGGFFGQYGREQHGLRPTVIPRYVPASPTSAHTTPDADDSSDE